MLEQSTREITENIQTLIQAAGLDGVKAIKEIDLEKAQILANNRAFIEPNGVSVTLQTVLKGVDEKDWQLFWSIPRMTDEQKLSFLCTMINGGMKEILYNDPKLIMEYVNGSS